MNNEQLAVWHQGELAVQKMAGTDKRMAEIGNKFIREFMPQQHRDFFQSLSMIFIGYNDYATDIFASVLFGPVGFIQSPTEHELIINTQYSINTDIKSDLKIGDRIGLVGIVFNTRRRNRVNGVVTEINQKSIRLRILQSYGNCPKYIQPKALTTNANYGEFITTTRHQLSANDKEVITNADVFFIASSFDDGQQLNNRGVDMSHRGGDAGFVTINKNEQLLVDDYFGNGFFNTMGNLYKNPIANLLFLDWRTGNAMQITVSSEILWNEDNAQNNTLTYSESTEAGKAKRTLCFTPIEIKHITNALAYCQITD
ncbi:pyridoxamine 5'-phosphate oxidase family protein [Pseudocolwellia sp. HL-MZ19]|uniref:pyridoxamine 5'-phosphate oxidase family protein n=1 Tax=unclassified Pseudocolwellia TaxID=2848178 RepID=UPI003CF75851